MKTLLLVAHPGHELLLWKWLGAHRPDVVVLTDGSGSAGVPRLHHTQAVVREAGAAWLPQLIPPVRDTDIYSALVEYRPALFRQWCDALTAHILEHRVERIVADQEEGFNPSHDLCRMLANIAAARAARAGHEISSFEFPSLGHPGRGGRIDGRCWITELSTTELEAKVSALRRYAAHSGGPLVQEVEELLATHGEQAYARECLFPARATRYEAPVAGAAKPYFEVRGEERVAQGVFPQVLRTEHLQFVADTLREAG